CSHGWIPVTAWCHVAACPTACCGSEQQAARDQQVAPGRALHRDDHWPPTQAPTLPITAMTATSRTARSTVYSIKAAPSSSLPRRRTRVRAFDMRHSEPHGNLRFRKHSTFVRQKLQNLSTCARIVTGTSI